MIQSAERRPHEPTTHQLFSPDSEISPSSPVAPTPTQLSPLSSRAKRAWNPSSPYARPGGDQQRRKGFEPPPGPARMDEPFIAEMLNSMRCMAQAVEELKQQNQLLVGEFHLCQQWRADNFVETTRRDSVISDNSKNAYAFTTEKFNEVKAYLTDSRFKERIVHIEEIVEKHHFTLDHLYSVKPKEGNDILYGFAAVAEEIKQLKQSNGQNEQTIAQITTELAQSQQYFATVADASHKEVQKNLDEIRSEVSIIKNEIDNAKPPMPNPPGYERPTRQTQFCGGYGGYGGCGDYGGCGGDGDAPYGPPRTTTAPPPRGNGGVHGWSGGCEGHGGARQWGTGGGTSSGGAQHWNGTAADSTLPDGKCHCHHVDKLIQDMAAVQARTARAPFLPPQGAADGASEPYSPENDTYGAPLRDPPTGSTTQLPLTLGFLGISLTSGRIFDDKISIHEDFRFNGHRNGHAWKAKTERYFITRVPALSQILRWAEREENPISPERLKAATGDGLLLPDRDGSHVDHTDALNTAIWGFLGNCITGEADVMYKQAAQCNGIDAWRRIVRFIDSGRNIRLEQLRQEVRMIRSFPIKNLESVTIGIASFENKIKDYIEAGGRAPPQDEMKSDLNAILPHELSDYLTVRVTDTHQSYESFRDHAVQACAQLLMRKKRLPVNHVHEEENGDDSEINAEEFGQANSKEELDQMYLAAVNRFQGRGRAGKAGGAAGARGRAGKGAGKAGGAAGDRPPAKCTNCGGEHAAFNCPKPTVDRAQRPCWVCNKVGHIGRDCPQKKSQPIKAVSDQGGSGTVQVINGVPMPCWNIDDSDKFTDVRGFDAMGNKSDTNSIPICVTTRRKEAFPRPSRITMGMHLVNKFLNSRIICRLRGSNL